MLLGAVCIFAVILLEFALNATWYKKHPMPKGYGMVPPLIGASRVLGMAPVLIWLEGDDLKFGLITYWAIFFVFYVVIWPLFRKRLSEPLKARLNVTP